VISLVVPIKFDNGHRLTGLWPFRKGKKKIAPLLRGMNDRLTHLKTSLRQRSTKLPEGIPHTICLVTIDCCLPNFTEGQTLRELSKGKPLLVRQFQANGYSVLMHQGSPYPTDCGVQRDLSDGVKNDLTTVMTIPTKISNFRRPAETTAIM
jgi:hypothetical protein